MVVFFEIFDVIAYALFNKLILGIINLSWLKISANELGNSIEILIGAQEALGWRKILVDAQPPVVQVRV